MRSPAVATIDDSDAALSSINADVSFMNELTYKGTISPQARTIAIHLLRLANNWSFWISKLLLLSGASLLLAGIIFFFAFNWRRIRPAAKLAAIEAALAACVGAAIFVTCNGSLQESILAQTLILAASILVGVFLAVFGQIYQTGADSYLLFGTWALLILPWALLARFAVLWLAWLAIANIFLLLYFTADSDHAYPKCFSPLILVFNCPLLALREFLVQNKGASFLASEWTRVVLIIGILSLGHAPIQATLSRRNRAGAELKFTAALSIALHAVLFWAYQNQASTLLPFALTLLSICIFLEITAYRILGWLTSNFTVQTLSMLLVTVTLFSLTALKLSSHSQVSGLSVVEINQSNNDREDHRFSWMPRRTEHSVNARQLIDALITSGHVDPQNKDWIESQIIAAVKQEIHRMTPIASRILAGIGSLTGCFFLLQLCLWFFDVLKLNTKWGQIAWGSLLCLISFGLLHISEDNRNSDGCSLVAEVLMQLSVCAMIAGKSLCACGMLTLLNSHWGVVLSSLVTALVTYNAYGLAVDRFLSSLAVLLTAFFSFTIHRSKFESHLRILFLLIVVSIDGLFAFQPELGWNYLAVSYAVKVTLCVIVIYHCFNTRNIHGNAERLQLRCLKAFVTANLALLIYWIFLDNNKQLQLTEACSVAILSALFLGIVSSTGFTLSVSLLIFGYAQHDNIVLVLGFLLAPAFISLYYYNRSITLLAKSGVLCASGIILLVGYGYVTLKFLSNSAISMPDPDNATVASNFDWPILAIALIILTVLNGLVIKNELLKSRGSKLLLELIPADPRSLMQGDYMQLAYALERQAPKPPEKCGKIVLKLDSASVGSFDRFYGSGRALKQSEMLLRYHCDDGGNLKIWPDSFMFQEGHAQYYAGAKYGVFGVDDSGSSLLVGLANSDKVTILS